MNFRNRWVAAASVALTVVPVLVSPASACPTPGGGRPSSCRAGRPAGAGPRSGAAAPQRRRCRADADLDRRRRHHPLQDRADDGGRRRDDDRLREQRGDRQHHRDAAHADLRHHDEGYNHDVNLNILANPFDANNGRHQATVTLTPGKYRYFCAIPGHSTMVGEFVVTGGGGDDTTPPTVTAAVSGPARPDGQLRRHRRRSPCTAADAGSGVATVEYQIDDTGFLPYTAPVVVTAIGDHAVQFRATDKAGNVSPVGSVPFRVVEPADEDTTPPTVAAALAGDRDDDGNYIGTATVTVDRDRRRIRRRHASSTRSTAAAFTAVHRAGRGEPAGRAHGALPGHRQRRQHVARGDGRTSPWSSRRPRTPPRPRSPPRWPVTGTTTATTSAARPSRSRPPTPGPACATIEYALDAGRWTAYTAPVTVRAAGAHTVRYRATDNAGNVAAEKSVDVHRRGRGTGRLPRLRHPRHRDHRRRRHRRRQRRHRQRLHHQRSDRRARRLPRPRRRSSGTSRRSPPPLVTGGTLTRRRAGRHRPGRRPIGRRRLSPRHLRRQGVPRCPDEPSPSSPPLSASSPRPRCWPRRPAAHADLVTYCIGTGGAVTVPNDLYVPGRRVLRARPAPPSPATSSVAAGAQPGGRPAARSAARYGSPPTATSTRPSTTRRRRRSCSPPAATASS